MGNTVTLGCVEHGLERDGKVVRTIRWEAEAGHLQKAWEAAVGRGTGDKGSEMLNRKDPSLDGTGGVKGRYRERPGEFYPRVLWPFSVSSASSFLQTSEDMSLPQRLVILYPSSIKK